MDEEESKSKYADEEASKSEYAYMLSSVGLINVEISNIETKPQFKLGLAVSAEPGEIPFGSGVFSHSNSIYLFGGSGKVEDSFFTGLLQFDHNKFQKLPPNTNIPSFKSLEKHPSNYYPIILPLVVRSPDGVKTYFLSDTYMNDETPSAFELQSFDAIQNLFTEYPLPPIPRFPNGLDPHYGVFLLGPCLYLFVDKTFHTPSYTLTFNTSLESSEWRVNEELLSQFDIKNIPPPNEHRGDIGLSEVHPDDNTRIMLALAHGQVIAYRIHIEQGWESFTPISHRFLTEIHTPHPATRAMDGWAHLTDFGGRKFCVVYGSMYDGLVISVFRINFDIERDIQRFEVDSGKFSSEILGRQRFCLSEELANVTLSRAPYLGSEICFLSALPASTGKDDDKDEDPHFNNQLRP